jgi:hypothetical protein
MSAISLLIPLAIRLIVFTNLVGITSTSTPRICTFLLGVRSSPCEHPRGLLLACFGDGHIGLIGVTEFLPVLLPVALLGYAPSRETFFFCHRSSS